ncbi:hypothetical protein HDU76_010510 [Blyttiomyces sp. JEL0837]|nr:hypothetical protein HDU76_010510 [Blyttiomyces sp. JEL0837]
MEAYKQTEHESIIEILSSFPITGTGKYKFFEAASMLSLLPGNYITNDVFDTVVRCLNFLEPWVMFVLGDGYEDLIGQVNEAVESEESLERIVMVLKSVGANGGGVKGLATLDVKNNNMVASDRFSTSQDLTKSCLYQAYQSLYKLWTGLKLQPLSIVLKLKRLFDKNLGLLIVADLVRAGIDLNNVDWSGLDEVGIRFNVIRNLLVGAGYVDGPFLQFPYPLKDVEE